MLLASLALATAAWGKPSADAAPQEPPPEAAAPALEAPEAPSKPTLTLEESSATVMSAGTGRRILKVKVKSNVEWTAISQYPWIRITGGASGTGNGIIKYKVSPYHETGMRSGAIMLEGEGISRSFMILQKGVHPSLKLGSQIRVFDSSGYHDKELRVFTHLAWTAKSSEPWLVVKKGSGEGDGIIYYNLAPHKGRTARLATITVTGGGLTRTFQVKQLSSIKYSVPFWVSLALSILIVLLVVSACFSSLPPAPPAA